MENASKALIIAAGVFMAISLVVIAVNLFVHYRGVAQTYDELMSVQEISKINKEFEKYVGREDITMQEVVAAAQTANNINARYNVDKIKIKVILDGEVTKTDGESEEAYKNRYITLIKQNLGKKYEVNQINYYDDLKDGYEDYKKLIKNISFKYVTGP